MKMVIFHQRRMRLIALFMASILVFSLLASTVSVVKAEGETEESTELTTAEMEEMARAESAAAGDTTAKLGDGEYDIYKDFGDDYDKEFAEDFNAVMDRTEVGLWGDLIINGLKYIGNKAYNKAEGKAIDKVWNIIFGGGDNANKEVLDKLNKMDGKLDDMNKQLVNIMNLIAEDSVKKEINAKLEVMGKFDKSLSTDYRHYNEAENEADKHTALDSWHDRTYPPMKNSFELTEWYCEKITNEKNTSMSGDFFSNYDKYAYLHWPWENSGVPFRQLQRERDIYLITQMMAMNYLWLQKEYEADPTNIKKYKGDVDSLNKAIDKVIKLYNDKKVQYTPGVNRIHYGKASLQIKLESGAHLKTYELFDKHIKEGHDAHDLDREAQAQMTASTPKDASLITKTAIFDILAPASRAEALKPSSSIKSLRDLLRAGDYNLHKYSTRIHYEGRVKGSPLFHNHDRNSINIYLNHVNMTKTGKDVEHNTFVCHGPNKLFDNDVFAGGLKKREHGRYKAIWKSNDNTSDIFGNYYENIWVLSSSNIEEDHYNDDLDVPDEEVTVDMTIKTIEEDNYFEGTLDDGSHLTFRVQDEVPVEGKSREELKVGDRIKLTYVRRTLFPEEEVSEKATKIVYVDPGATPTPTPVPSTEPSPDPTPNPEPDPSPLPEPTTSDGDTPGA